MGEYRNVGTENMILVIQSQLLHYRRDFFNALTALDQVVIAHSGNPARRPADRFEEVLLPARPLGPFWLQQGLFELLRTRRPRTVIAMFDVRWINTMLAMYRLDKHLGWVWWGLDRGKSALANRTKLLIARRQNPIIFYNEKTRSSFASDLLPKDRLFVANNTFHVPDRIKSYLNPVKNRIINVGSLDSRKQNDVTIRVLKKIREETGADIRFTLIGDGPERERLAALVVALGMQDRVELVGKIEDPKVLANYYGEAIASVSFGQAGLAVLQSMAFGVPFVTKRNAISGGEINNIKDGKNGVIVDANAAALQSALLRLINNVEAARRLGEAAYRHYSEEATLEKMIESFELATSYRVSTL